MPSATRLFLLERLRRAEDDPELPFKFLHQQRQLPTVKPPFARSSQKSRADGRAGLHFAIEEAILNAVSAGTMPMPSHACVSASRSAKMATSCGRSGMFALRLTSVPNAFLGGQDSHGVQMRQVSAMLSRADTLPHSCRSQGSLVKVDFTLEIAALRHSESIWPASPNRPR
uniref:hypothetical protein n=1 Tax=Cupriavidus necator TaxID=106590 RepID=UPI003F498608